jgi:DNA-binding XRE family transcriptional regulator
VKPSTRAKLEKAGFAVGTADEFLGLSETESKLVAVKLALASDLKQRRLKAGITQTELAKQLQSSQSRIAKMEAADPSVSVDLLLKALFSTGATPASLAPTFSHTS